MPQLSRRTFLQATAGSVAVAVWAPAAAGQHRWRIGGFTKVLQDLSPAETARVAAAAGWDGIELPVRAGGHVLPDRVDEDLPPFVAALRARGQQVLVIATDVRGADTLSERVLGAAARAGIRRYRLGHYRYRDGIAIPAQLDEFRARLKDLAALNAQLGLTGLIQNHSGNGYVGAAVWDVYSLVRDLDPRQVGVHFDIGHATVEGGLSWPTNFALVSDHVGAVIVKDFTWKMTPGKGGVPEWCPIGQGMIDPRFFTLLKATSFSGPITMQYEYRFENDSVDARLRALQADNAQVQAWIDG